MKIASDKIGRFFWSIYLVVVFPVCAICVISLALTLREYSAPPAGVMESAPGYHIETALMVASLAALPVLWVLGVCLAYRFNGRWRPVVPFIANLIPVTVLTVAFFPDPQSKGGAGLEPIFVYLLFMNDLLILGLIAVMITAIKGRS